MVSFFLVPCLTLFCLVLTLLLGYMADYFLRCADCSVVHPFAMVTVNGTISSWWFGKPSALRETLLHATVYNFGSICYGSLLIDIMHVHLLTDTFTQSAYPYVGLYHYGLQEAGHKATELFEKRGWSRIVREDILTGVLSLCSLGIGGLSECFAVLLERFEGEDLMSIGQVCWPYASGLYTLLSMLIFCSALGLGA